MSDDSLTLRDYLIAAHAGEIEQYEADVLEAHLANLVPVADFGKKPEQPSTKTHAASLSSEELEVARQLGIKPEDMKGAANAAN